jgi:hypothetical protein
VVWAVALGGFDLWRGIDAETLSSALIILVGSWVGWHGWTGFAHRPAASAAMVAAMLGAG